MKLSERRHFQEEASHFPSNAVSCRWLLFAGWGMLLSENVGGKYFFLCAD